MWKSVHPPVARGFRKIIVSRRYPRYKAKGKTDVVCISNNYIDAIRQKYFSSIRSIILRIIDIKHKFFFPRLIESYYTE